MISYEDLKEYIENNGLSIYVDEEIISTLPLLIKKIDLLEEAITPFAEEPSKKMDNYPCHFGINTKERCGRCLRAVAAYNALKFLRRP